MQTTVNKKRYRDGWFDDAFEVIYENELPDRDESTYTDNTADFHTDRNGTASRSRSGQEAEDTDENRRNEQRKNQLKQTEKQKVQKSRGGAARSVASSAGKVLKTGGTVLQKTLQTVGRIATLVLTAAITFLLATSFWENLSFYGNPATAVAEQNYTLAAYAGVALLLLAFEVLTFFWALTGPYVSENRRVYRADTGRGMFSFLLIGAGSWAAGVFAELIPSSPAFLTGLSGALTVYGSLSQILLVLCIAGVISCLVRKFT